MGKIVSVVNAKGPYDETPPSGYDSWIDFWNKRQGKVADHCYNCGKKNTKLDGGHVEYFHKSEATTWEKLYDMYIVPLCDECNKPVNTRPFPVDENDLVHVPDEKQKKTRPVRE